MKVRSFWWVFAGISAIILITVFSVPWWAALGLCWFATWDFKVTTS